MHGLSLPACLSTEQVSMSFFSSLPRLCSFQLLLEILSANYVQYIVYADTFLPRDAMRKRGLCCRSVSVCPSVTLVYCIQTAEDIVKFLSRPGSPIILVF